RTLFLHLESVLRGFVSVVGFGKPGHWHGLPPAAHASRLQDSEVGRVFPDHLRDSGARGRADLLGGYAPHSSSVLRSGRRSAFADRWQVVGAHGLDSYWTVHAPRH